MHRTWKSLVLFVALGTGVGPRFVLAAAPAGFSETWVGTASKLWTEPNQFAAPMALLQPGLNLKILEYSTSGDWMKVETPSGREGWILVRHTTQDKRRAAPLVSAAQQGLLEQEGPGRDPASTGNVPVAAAAPKTLQFAVAPQFTARIKPSTALGGGVGGWGLYQVAQNFQLGAAFFWNTLSRDTDVDEFYSVSLKTRAHLLAGPMVSYQKNNFRLAAVMGWDYNNIRLSITDQATGQDVTGTIADITPGVYSESAFGMRLAASVLAVTMDSGMGLEFGAAWSTGFYSGSSLVPDEPGSQPHQLDFFAALTF